MYQPIPNCSHLSYRLPLPSTQGLKTNHKNHPCFLPFLQILQICPFPSLPYCQHPRFKPKCLTQTTMGISSLESRVLISAPSKPSYDQPECLRLQTEWCHTHPVTSHLIKGPPLLLPPTTPCLGPRVPLFPLQEHLHPLFHGWFHSQVKYFREPNPKHPSKVASHFSVSFYLLLGTSLH